MGQWCQMALVMAFHEPCCCCMKLLLADLHLYCCGNGAVDKCGHLGSCRDGSTQGLRLKKEIYQLGNTVGRQAVFEGGEK